MNVALKFTWRKIGLVIIAGVVVGFIAMTSTAEIYKNSLRTRANTISDALDTARVDKLRNTPLNQDSGDYTYLRNKLAAIKASNSDVRFVYLMGRNDNGEVYFIADSEPPGSESYSPRGEPFPEASSALKSMFDTHTDLVEGPLKDSYGNWLSALAPMVNDENYKFVGVVGIDVPASFYSFLLTVAGGVPIVLALLTSLIIYIVDRGRRRRQEALQFRAEMVSIASHELRTPLTGLRWSEENLLQQKLASKNHQAVQDMYDSTIRLQNSIEDILQLASMTTVKAHQLNLEECNIRTMLEDVFAMQKLAAERKELKLQFAANLPEKIIVMADQRRLKRVLNNLVSNAIKYSKQSSSVKVGYQTNESANAHVISIQDHGIGIPSAEQSKVFEGFYRASNTAQSQVNGNGMGLYLSKQMIEQHGGMVWLESVEGRGTTLFVQLPKSNKQTDKSNK